MKQLEGVSLVACLLATVGSSNSPINYLPDALVAKVIALHKDFDVFTQTELGANLSVALVQFTALSITLSPTQATARTLGNINLDTLNILLYFYEKIAW